MKKTLFPALAVALTLPLAARADHLPMPKDAPPSYKTECGSCHLAFPAALLTASDWRLVMTQLPKHYGDNATLDQKARQPLEDFLVRNAGSPWRLTGAGDPPRLTATSWFQRKHDELSSAVWRDKRVGSAANCVACHPNAERGGYGEREVTVRGHTRRRDHDG
jgi:cytochrome c553